MFAVTVAFGNISWRLLYKNEEKAVEHFGFVSTGGPGKTHDFNASERIQITDDFGQRAMFVHSAITGVMLENLDESKIGAIEMGLHQQRVQGAFQARAEQDPTIRAAGGRGPGIIAPMGNGRLS